MIGRSLIPVGRRRNHHLPVGDLFLKAPGPSEEDEPRALQLRGRVLHQPRRDRRADVWPVESKSLPVFLNQIDRRPARCAPERSDLSAGIFFGHLLFDLMGKGHDTRVHFHGVSLDGRIDNRRGKIVEGLRNHAFSSPVPVPACERLCEYHSIRPMKMPCPRKEDGTLPGQASLTSRPA